MPLFTTMVTFAEPLALEESAMAMVDDVLWFAARTAAKPGMERRGEDWTLVSSPEFAMKLVEETPMQTEEGEFIPQSRDYLRQVPGRQMVDAFCSLLRREGLCDGDPSDPPLALSYLGAQRWGSALPAHRHLDDSSPTRKVLRGVAYDPKRCPLAPTQNVKPGKLSFVKADDLNLFQCGDMVSTYSPGLEGAALSALELADYLAIKFK